MGNGRYAELTVRLSDELNRLRQGDALTDRQVAILNEGRMLLAEEGLAAFSLRQLAQRVDMKLASLQYHLATRRELVDALLRQGMTRYSDEFLTMMEESNDTPVVFFGQVIEFLVQEARKDARFEFQIWAMAAHDSGARRVHVVVSQIPVRIDRGGKSSTERCYPLVESRSDQHNAGRCRTIDL